MDSSYVLLNMGRVCMCNFILLYGKTFQSAIHNQDVFTRLFSLYYLFILFTLDIFTQMYIIVITIIITIYTCLQ